MAKRKYNTAQLKYIQALKEKREKEAQLLEAGGIVSQGIGEMAGRKGLMPQAGPAMPGEEMGMINPKIQGNRTGLLADATPEQQNILNYRKGLLESANPVAIAQGLGGQENYMKSLNKLALAGQADPARAPTSKVALNPQGERVFATNEQIAGGGFSPAQPDASFANLMQMQMQQNNPVAAQEKSFAKAQGTAKSSELATIVKSGVDSRKTLINLKSMKRKLDSGLSTGALAGIKGVVGNIANSFGAPEAFVEGLLDTSNLQIFKSGVMDLVMTRIAGTKGSISEKEMAAFEKSVANTTNTTQANKLLLEMGIKIEQRNIEKAKHFRGASNADDFDKKSESWFKKLEPKDIRRKYNPATGLFE